MTTTELLAWSLHVAREHSLRLLVSVPEQQACSQAQPDEHHPTWTAGHLVLGDVYLLFLLGVAAIPADFEALIDRYGPPGRPIPSPDHYDSYASLVERLVDTGARRHAAISQLGAADLGRLMPDSTLRRAQPTIGHHLQTLVYHEGYHAGQVAAWRRRHGLGSVPWTFATPVE